MAWCMRMPARFGDNDDEWGTEWLKVESLDLRPGRGPPADGKVVFIDGGAGARCRSEPAQRTTGNRPR